MNKNERLKVYEKLESQKGRKHQIIVAIEELSELIKELTKILRTDSYSNLKNLCDEIADVKICIEQLERFFITDNKILDTITEFKLKRLELFYLNKDKKTFYTESAAIKKETFDSIKID